MVTDAWVWLLLTGTPQKFGYQNNSEELMCFNNLFGKLQLTHLWFGQNLSYLFVVWNLALYLPEI